MTVSSAGQASIVAALLAGGCYQGSDEDPSASETGTSGGESSSGVDGDDESSGESGAEVPGAVVPEPLHRLNRLEYNNTIRDLLAVTITPADSFPPDNAVQGFDNVAEGLTLTPSQMDLYALAAREVADAALKIRPRYAVRIGARAHAEATGQAGTAFDWGWSMPRGFTGVLNFPVEVGQDETVTFSVLAGGDAVGKPTPEMGLTIDGVEVGHWVVTSLPTAPVEYTVAAQLLAGAHTIGVTFPNGEDQPAENVFNSLVVGYLDVKSDALTVPPGRALVYVCDPVAAPVPDDCYRAVVGRFAERAWRRPLTPAEGESLFTLFQQLRVAEGDDEAVRLVVRAVLLSAKFLYRPSFAGPGLLPGAPEGLVPLDDHVLASRLSYFLWSSMPDEELMQRAGGGDLRSEDGLREQVQRMLLDPRAAGLRRGFAAQWLSTRALAVHAPDPTTFPQFDEPLRAAMTAEAELFFADFLGNGLTIGEMMTPDFTYTNDRLAAHYGSAPPGSPEMVRVPAAPGQRRGLLFQGAWLTATSASNRSSPVVRGRWILEQLLCVQMPPPPPDIPPLMEPAEGATVREILAEHRKNPACAGCHNLLDPAGLGMEGFDGVGVQRKLEGGAPVDESGAIPPELPFVGPAELASLLAHDPRFVACLTDKLFAYALGRAKVPDDAPWRNAITEALPDEGDSLDRLIELIALSPAFRMRSEEAD